MQHGRTTHNASNTQLAVAPTEKCEYERALQKLVQIVREGLVHGFFDCSISSEIINGKKRSFVIKAGVSHKFIIPLEELDACA